MATLCGVSREMWGKYERDVALPGAEVLIKAALAGIDVNYILTGQRSQPISPMATLAPRQRALLDNYEHSDEAGKKVIEGAAVLAAKSQGNAPGAGRNKPAKAA